MEGKSFALDLDDQKPDDYIRPVNDREEERLSKHTDFVMNQFD